MDILKLVLSILITGATLLAFGGLAEMATDLQKKAAHDTAVGIISISKWNRQLTEGHSTRRHFLKKSYLKGGIKDE